MNNTTTRRGLFSRGAAIAGLAGAGLALRPPRALAAGTVNWLAWAGQVEPSGIQGFFEKTGIRVNHISMSGNAETFAKLKLSGTAQYDLFEADGLWPLRYYEEGMIEPIDLDSLPNVKANMYPEFKKIPALTTSDGRMLMAPWGWNPTLLIYNKKRVTTPPTSYEALLDPKYKGHVGFSDQHEFMWPVAAMLLGFEDPFAMNKEQLNRAKDVLIRIKRNAPTITKGWNEQLRLYIEETVWIGMSSPGRALTVHASGGPEMGTSPPKEGYYGWIDGDMPVKGSPNRESALAWINYIHNPEYVATNFARLQRGTANRAGVELLRQRGKDDIVTANMMDRPDVAGQMRLIRAPKNPEEYAAAWNEVLAA
jgi:spermidine/putrescine-binding protein